MLCMAGATAAGSFCAPTNWEASLHSLNGTAARNRCEIVLNAAHCCIDRRLAVSTSTAAFFNSGSSDSGSCPTHEQLITCRFSPYRRFTETRCPHHGAAHQRRLRAGLLLAQLLGPTTVEVLRDLLDTVVRSKVKHVLQLQRPLVALPITAGCCRQQLISPALVSWSEQTMA